MYSDNVYTYISMKRIISQHTSSQSKNIFGHFVTRPFWVQYDFWLACSVALSFWLSIAINRQFSFQVQTFTSILFFLIVVFPVLEEIVFRGLIQESIHNLLLNYHIKTVLFNRLSSANLLTSLVFSASHLWSHTLLWAVAAFFPSLIFGYFKDKYQSLQASITLHMLYNFGYYLFL